MRHFILLLGIVLLLLAGCSPQTDTVDSEEQIQELSSSNNQIPEESTKGSDRVENKREEMIIEKAETQEENQTVFIGAGKIGDYPIHGTFDLEKKLGTYSYDKYNIPIELRGSSEMVYAKNVIGNKLYTYYEDDKGETSLTILQRDEDYLQGVWCQGDVEYPFYLIREGSNRIGPVTTEKIQELQGTWTGEEKSYFAGTSAEIKVLFDDLIWFSLEAYNGTASGSMGGFAIKDEKTNEIIFECIYDEPDTEVIFKLIFKDGKLQLESNDYGYGCGAGVFFETNYIKGTIKSPLPSALDVGIVLTKEQEELFKTIVGEKYEDFISLTQHVMYEEISFEDTIALGGQSYLRGASGYCYYLVVDQYIYAALEEDKLQYYTNDSRYKDCLPAPIEEWATGYGSENNISYHFIETQE